MKPIESSERVLLPSTFQISSMLPSSILSRFVFVCLFTSMYFRKIGNDDSWKIVLTAERNMMTVNIFSRHAAEIVIRC